MPRPVPLLLSMSRREIPKSRSSIAGTLGVVVVFFDFVEEHFGFRDGIAQPTIDGAGRPETRGNMIPPGEILLGHHDGYGNVTDSPMSSSGVSCSKTTIASTTSSAPST